MNTTTRILIVDDHPVLAIGVQRLLVAQDGFEVVAVLDSVTALKRYRPAWDVLVLDVNLPDGNGLNLLDELLLEYPTRRVVIYSVAPAEQFGFTAIARGASAYIEKNDPPSELREAVRRAAIGESYISDSLASVLAAAHSSHADLTNLETEAAQLLAMGCRPSQIADLLQLTVETVSVHLANARKKLGANSNVDLARVFSEFGS